MKHFIVLYRFQSSGNWVVYHLTDGHCVMSEDTVSIVVPEIEKLGYSYFVFDVDGLCNLSTKYISEVTYDWR